MSLLNQLHQWAQQNGLKTWTLGDRQILPVVQGGMGVGVSASRLAGSTARLGAMGTISSVDLRRLHPDLWEATRKLDKEPDAREQIDRANLIALDREILRAKQIAEGNGAIAVNVMKAVSAYEPYVRQDPGKWCRCHRGWRRLALGPSRDRPGVFPMPA